MSLLTSISIVIPTFNRPEYVMRSMRYWSDYDSIVHVFDGSKVPIDDNLISTLGSNINYHHMPCSLMERLYKSIKVIDTEYSIMISDDEFFIPSALESCIQEMNNNHDIVSCMGLAIFFRVQDKKMIGNLIYHPLREHSLLQEKPVDRSVYHMSNYVPSTIYSVMRSDIWKQSMRSLSYKNFEAYVKAIGELQFEITSSYLGKTKIINELLWIRSFENEPIRIQESEATVPIKDFWYKESNKLMRDEIISTVVQSISSKKDKATTITQDVSLAFDAFINTKPGKPLNSFKHKVADAILPKSIVSLIIRLVFENPLHSMSKITKTLNKKSTKVDIDALKEIEKTVLDFHSNYKNGRI